MTHNRNGGLRLAALDGLVWGVGGKAALIVGNFAVLMVTSRSLSAEEFGVYAVAMVFSDLSWALATSAFGIALVQKSNLSEDEVGAGLIAFAVTASLVALVMALGGRGFESIFRAPGLSQILWVMAAASAIKVMTGFYGALLQRKLDLKFYQLTQNLPQLLGGCALTVIGALLGWGVWALVVGYAFAASIELLLTIFRTKIDYRVPRSWEPFRALFSVGGAPLANRMVNFLATSIDRVIIGATLGPAALGIYTRAYSIMMVPVRLFGMTIERTLLPIFSTLQDDEPRLGRALQRILRSQPVIFIPAGIGLVISAPILVSTILGDGWNQVILPSQILMGALAARLGYVASEAAAIAIGEASGAAKRQAVYAVLVTVGGLAGLPLGLAGVATGVTLALFAFYLLSLRRAVQRLRCSPWDIVNGHLRGALISAVAWTCGMAVTALSQFGVEANYAEWLGISAYGATVVALMGLAPEGILGSDLSDLRAQGYTVARRRLLGMVSGVQR